MENIRKESLAAELFAIFYIQKKPFRVTFFLVFFCFLAYAVLASNIYSADGTFLIKAKRPERSINILDFSESGVGVAEITEKDIYTESEILSSNEVLADTAAKIIKKKLINIETNTKNEQLMTEDLAKKINFSLTVDVLPKSKIVHPVILWDNPKDAEIVLHTLMWTYLEHRKNIENPIESIDFLKKQVSTYLAEWRNKKLELLSLTEKYNAPDPILELSNNLLLKKEYISQIDQQEQKRDELKADVDTLAKMLGDGENHLYSFLSNAVMMTLVESLQKVQKDKEDAEKIFLSKRVEVKDANDVFQNSYKTIKSEAALLLQQQRSTLKVTNESLDLLIRKLKALEHRNIELKKISLQMEQLQRESALMGTSFEVFYKRRDESQLKGNLESNVSIISHAKAQLQAVQPVRVKIVFLGLFLSIALSLLVVFILDFIDQTIKTPRDAENYLYAPVIFSMEDLYEEKSDKSDKRFFYLVAVIFLVLFLMYLGKRLHII